MRRIAGILRPLRRLARHANHPSVTIDRVPTQVGQGILFKPPGYKMNDK